MNNKLQKKFAICCLIMILISPASTGYAATVEEVGNGLAEYAKSFAASTTAENSKVKTHYVVGDASTPDSERTYAYKDMQSPKCGHNSFGNGVTDLGMDCVGWASYAIHHSLGLGGDEFTYFVTPQSLAQDASFTTLSYSASSAKPGDILIANNARFTHVMIYVGDGKMVDSGNAEGGHPGVDLRDVSYYEPITNMARITPEAAAGITSIVKTYNGTAVSVSASTGKSIDYGNFFFNGIPDGKYSLASRKSLISMFIEAFSEIIDFFIGYMTYLLRGFIIGIVSILDRLINNTIQSISDAPKSLEETGVSATSADDPYSMNRHITIEGLVFGDIDLFDINIFKVD